MFFFPTSTFEISLIIPKTPTKFNTDWDGIPSIVLKYLPLNALFALCFIIFNQSLSQGKFILTFKQAKNSSYSQKRKCQKSNKLLPNHFII